MGRRALLDIVDVQVRRAREAAGPNAGKWAVGLGAGLGAGTLAYLASQALNGPAPAAPPAVAASPSATAEDEQNRKDEASIGLEALYTRAILAHLLRKAHPALGECTNGRVTIDIVGISVDGEFVMTYARRYALGGGDGTVPTQANLQSMRAALNSPTRKDGAVHSVPADRGYFIERNGGKLSVLYLARELEKLDEAGSAGPRKSASDANEVGFEGTLAPEVEFAARVFIFCTLIRSFFFNTNCIAKGASESLDYGLNTGGVVTSWRFVDPARPELRWKQGENSGTIEFSDAAREQMAAACTLIGPRLSFGDVRWDAWNGEDTYVDNGGRAWALLARGSGCRIYERSGVVAKIFDSREEAHVRAEVELMQALEAFVPKLSGFVRANGAVIGYTMAKYEMSLLARMQAQPLTEALQERLVAVIRGVCEKVRCLDIRPQNFVITGEDIRMIDFGAEFCAAVDAKMVALLEARVLYSVLLFCAFACRVLDGKETRLASLGVLRAMLMTRDFTPLPETMAELARLDHEYFPKVVTEGIRRGPCIPLFQAKATGRNKRALDGEFPPTFLLEQMCAFLKADAGPSRGSGG
jgi:hypothetical protein